MGEQLMRNSFLMFLLMVIFSFPGLSQERNSLVTNPYSITDSVRHSNSFWQSKPVQISIAPASFFAATALIWSQREEVRKMRNRYIPTFRHHYDDYMQYTPALAVFGLNAAGVKGKHSMKRAFVSYVFSVAIMGITVNTIKYTAKVERPSGGEFNSFPSGHTANSFMNATFLHKEYGQYRSPVYSILGYGASTATAIGRQLNNRHWVSDVLAGAGIGILSTELGYIIADRIYKDKGLHKPLRFDPFPVNKKPSFLEMRLGFGIATSHDLTKKVFGLRAKNGFNMGLEGAWFFSKNVGVGGEFAFTSFPISSDNVFADPTIQTMGTGVYTQPMGVRYLHAGPFFSIPLVRNWFITGKLTVGSSVGAKGDVMLELNDEYQDLLGMKELPLLRYKPEVAFSWSTGAGIQKRIGRNTALKLYANYFASNHDFEIDTIDEVDADGKFSYKLYEKERVKFNHLVLGLGFTAFLW